MTGTPGLHKLLFESRIQKNKEAPSKVIVKAKWHDEFEVEGLQIREIFKLIGKANLLDLFTASTTAL